MRIFCPAMWPRCPSLRVLPAVVCSPGAQGPWRSRFERAPGFPWIPGPTSLDDLDDPARAHGPAALADREQQALLHGDGLDQIDLHLGVVTGHDHLGALGQMDDAG